jgi:ABC-type multidrug transport system fused ATPase/permease subunit
MIIDEEKTRRRVPDRVLLARLLRYLTAHRKALTLLFLVIFAGIGTSLAIPYLTQVAIDQYLLNTDLPTADRLAGLTFVIVVLAVVYFAGYPISFARTYLTTRTGRQVEYELRMDLFSHLQRLSLSYYDRREVGRTMSRVTNDVDNLTELITSGVVTAVADSFTLIGILVIMLYMSLSLSLTAFVILPFMVGFIWFFGQRSRQAYRRTRRTISGVTSHIEESVSGMKEIQAHSRERASLRTFDDANVRNLQANIDAARVQSLFFPAVGVFSAAGLALVLWAGGSAYIANPSTMPWGVLFAFIQYLNRFFFPIQNLSMFYNNVQSAMSGAERIVDLLDTEVDVPEAVDATALPPVAGAIRFERVTFSYAPDAPVLRDFDLTVAPKETLAIVGPTGAGKTTLINLIYRFYDPQKGRITVDGHDLRAVTLASLRNQMAIVLQDPFLFAGSIRDNIRYGRPDATDDDVVAAATAVGAHAFIAALPKGYDTDVGERGVRISMGQRQLISFARALLVDPAILILDEATSSVDAYTELVIQGALAEILRGRTAFVIAHRLSTVRSADRIVVLDAGRIVEEGDHQQLLAQRGLYRRLYDMQFR